MMLAIIQGDLKERLEVLLEKSMQQNAFVFLLDKGGVYVDCRVPDESRLWSPKNDLPGKTIEEFLPPELAIARRFYFEQAVKTQRVVSYAYNHPLYTGRSMSCSIQPVSDNHYLMVVRDVQIIPIPAAYIFQTPHVRNNGRDRS